MNIKKTLVSLFLLGLGTYGMAQVNVDVNLNIKHSVDGISDFGRERHMTIHSSPLETDWIGEEDKLDYLINDLHVFFGRDNGSATWKFKATTQDPARPNMPNVEQMKGLGTWLKGEYESNTKVHQYYKNGGMIMGTNPHPTYPTLSWNGDGNTTEGWAPQNVETSAEWMEVYLDNFFSKGDGAPGEPMPKYWEVINEPDMIMMTGSMTCTSQEKLWEYHNLVATKVKARLGAKAPKIGGMTWGLHDLYNQDGVSRYGQDHYDQWLSAESKPVYHAMMDSEVAKYRANDWYQWDVMWQGFIDACGANMDFHSVHIYDWPSWSADNINIRAGGHTEAMLDLLEWYDNFKFGKKKDVLLSEYGAVSNYIDKPTLDTKRRDWENLKPFNSMLMQFLERPSQIILSMPFTPIKAEWGDYKNAAGVVTNRYPYTMMNKDASGKWQWTEFIKFFELWSDVDGTRIDTKAYNNDIQVDAYVKGKHVYLILNNLTNTTTELKLNLFDDTTNPITGVVMKDLYLDETIGAGTPVLARKEFKTAPGSVIIDGEGTIIIDYTFANDVTINQESKEKRFMSARLATGNNSIGNPMVHVKSSNGALTTQINNVVVPAVGEAVLRIGGKFWSSSMVPSSVSINGKALTFDSNWRGIVSPTKNFWFGVLEIPVPVSFLAASNTVSVGSFGNSVDYSSVILQVNDFTKAPKRSGNNDAVAVTSIALETAVSVMQNKTYALTATFTPANASNKAISWSTSNAAVATVDKYGIVTAKATSGSATITATTANGKVATCNVTAIPFTRTAVTGLSIVQVSPVKLEFDVLTPLKAVIAPVNATEQVITWSSADETVAKVNATTGKVRGLKIGGTTTITASVNDNGTIKTANVTVTVGIVGEEKVYNGLFPASVNGNVTYNFEVPVNIAGERTVLVEMLNGTTVIGSGTKVVTAIGESVATVPVTLASLPAMGSNYSLRARLKNGASVISETTSPLQVLDVVHVTSNTMNAYNAEIKVGGAKQQLSVTIAPANAYNKNVTWSSNNAFASVTPTGLVSAVSPGTSIITATSVDGSKVASATINVVTALSACPTAVVLPKAIVVFPGMNYNFVETYLPTTLYEEQKGVVWKSSNTNIASISATGLVTASNTMGKVTITATSKCNSAILATSELTVGTTIIVEAEDYTNMGGAKGKIGKSTVGINNVQKGDWVEYTVYVPLTGDYNVNFVAGTEVTDGVIEMLVDGVSKGSKKVAVGKWDTYINNAMAAKVSLTEGTHTIRLLGAGTSDWQWNLDRFEMAYGASVDRVEMSKATLSLATNASSPLSATVYIGGVSNTNVTWASENNNIATVANGLVTAKAVGTTNIVATSVTNSALKAYCSVTVSATDPGTGTGTGSNTITIEAENFYETGGTFNDASSGGVGLGVKKNGSLGFNYMNGGDYALIKFNVSVAGTYTASAFTGTTVAGTSIFLTVDNATSPAFTAAIPNNNNWDAYVETALTGSVNLTVGEHILKVTGSTQDWLWNLDKVVLKGGSTSTSMDEMFTSNVKLYPNPTNSVLNIEMGEGSKFTTLSIISYTGQVLLNSNITGVSGKGQINVSGLDSGMYILKLEGEETVVRSFIKH